MRWRFLAFLPQLPSLEAIVGGTQIRPHHLFTRFAERGARVEVFETESPAGVERRHGGLRVAPLPTQRRGVLGLSARLAVMTALLEREARAAAAAGERFCYYSKLPVGYVLKGGLFPAPNHPGALLIPWARQRGIATWAAVHDLSPEHERTMLEREGVPSPARRRRLRSQARLGELEQRLLLPRASFVSAVAPPMLRLIERRYGLDPRRLSVFWSGVEPRLVESIPAWTPPRDRPWRVGYLGSPLDVNFTLLARSLRELNRDDVVLRVGGDRVEAHLDQARALYPRLEVRSGVRYANYADFAPEVDVWALPSDDSYLRGVTWQLKVPMALASGRPVVRSEGPVVADSDLGPFMELAGCTPRGFAEGLRRVLADPAGARARAQAARAHVLQHYPWDRLADLQLERLQRCLDELGPTAER